MNGNVTLETRRNSVTLKNVQESVQYMVGQAPAALNFAADTGWDTDQPWVGTNLIHGEKCVISREVSENMPNFTEHSRKSFRNSRKIHGPHRRYFEMLC